MKNIMEICKDFGIEIPADKQTDFGKEKRRVAGNIESLALKGLYMLILFIW